MTAALINPSVLRWARKRAWVDHERLAKSVNVNPEKLLLWEQGEDQPTFKQAEKIAKSLHIPFGFLFLPHPPEETLPIPDLRTLGSHGIEDLSVNVLDLLYDVLGKQEWYKEYLIDLGAQALPFIASFDANADVYEIARDITETLDLTIDDRKKAKTVEIFLEMLASRAEAAGIWVMRSGVVGNDTHRGLDVNEFRGFAICDDIAPIVFINGKDAKAAQIFSLIHELSHLWIGKSGISNVSLESSPGSIERGIEKLCNAVAAEVLVPKKFFCTRWHECHSIGENADKLAKFFRVSTVVIARRAMNLGLIDLDAYIDYYQQQEKLWGQKEERQGGGNYYRNIPVRNGKRFTEAVLSSALENNLLLRDAGRLLNVNPSAIESLAKEMGIE